MFASVAEIDPHFAGFYLDNTDLVVMRSDGRRDVSATRAAIGSVFRDPDLLKANIRFRESRFSFRELYNWWNDLPQVFAVPGVVSIDLDEVRNALVVGIADEDAKPRVMQKLHQLGIPRPAIIIESIGRAEPLTLHDYRRAIWGGTSS
jgi:hypothetical protein